MKVYKGTDKNMKCRDFQYEIGKTVKSDGAIRCGDKGFHSCEAPLDVLRYYPMRDGNRYFEAEAGGKEDRTGADDSKIATSELTLKAEVGIKGLISAHFEYTKKKSESGTAGGDRSNLAGGYSSNLAGGDRSNLAGGDRSNLAGGESSLLSVRNGTAKGGLYSVLNLSEWECRDDKYVPIKAVALIVDGKEIKADTRYQLKNGEVVECEDDE